MKGTATQFCRWGFGLCLTVALVGVALMGQALAGRPFISATDAEIVDAGFLELETGIALSRNTRGGANDSSWSLPSVVFNLGLTENFEVDFATGFDLVREKIEGSRRRQLGSVAETSLTAKNRLFKGEGAIPSLATELTLIFPTQRRELLSAPSRKVGFTAVGVATAEAGPLTYHLNLGGGVVESPKRGLGTVGSLLWAIAGELPLGKNGLSAVIEFRGESVRGSLPDNTALGGLVWESPWEIKFDVAGFGGLSQGSDSWGITFGLAYAFKAIPWLAK
ncbi:MAG: hypothetical protein HYV04_13635 [Deltaproteobacteria bacterium]|nr:hypothetical protein [Deltaproteobacteria bacterium]